MSQKQLVEKPSRDDLRWEAVRRRDGRAEGEFFYSVKTTGVYCRPACAARLPRRENVRFHASTRAAELAGFRPCKRCKPNQPARAERDAALVARLCRFIEQRLDEGGSAPSLEQLAEQAKLSVFHTHRLFKANTGVTPKGYASARRNARVRRGLEAQHAVTEAIYAAGFGSSGRFYAQSKQLLGMTPSSYRAGGARESIRFTTGQCSLGALLVAATERGVCAILLGDAADALLDDLKKRFPKAAVVAADATFGRTLRQVIRLIEDPRAGAKLPLDIRGTAFQERVWRALTKIPAGRTLSYAEVAELVGSPRAVRAVASACAKNPLAVAVPCHRVVRADGALSGYRWGVERKRRLLEREAKP